MNAFRKCGFHPYDTTISGDHEFISQDKTLNNEEEIPALPATDMHIPKNSKPKPTGDYPKSVSPFYAYPPMTQPNTSSTGRKGGQAAVLVTSSPFKKSLE